MIGWGIFLFALLLLLWAPCGIYAKYNTNQTIISVFFGLIRIDLLRPRKKKAKTKKQANTTVKKKQKSSNKLTDFLPILQLVLDFLADFRKKLVIKSLSFKLTLGGSDPFDLSINYGRYWAVVGNLFPHLESVFTIEKRDVEILCDYTADATKVDAAIDIRLRFITLLHMVLHHGLRILKKYLQIINKAKDGAVS